MMWLIKYVLKWFGEQIAGDSLCWLVERFGKTGEVVFLLIFGVSLLLGAPFQMLRDNRRRRDAERKPRYGYLEYAIVILGGAAFIAAVAITAFDRPVTPPVH